MVLAVAKGPAQALAAVVLLCHAQAFVTPPVGHPAANSARQSDCPAIKSSCLRCSSKGSLSRESAS